MPDYAAQLTPEERWAVAAYIRALQLSQNAKQADVANGQHVEELHEIAKQAGMQPGFADPWGLPSTAVYGTPNGEDNGIPGQAQAATMAPQNRAGGANTQNSGNSNGTPMPSMPAPSSNGQSHSLPQGPKQ